MPDGNFTVVVPTYNRAESLRATLKALGAQVVPPGLQWDVLVVDNNSRDHTPKVVEEFARTARTPVHYYFEARAGKSRALNAGIARASSNFLLFTDDDVLPSPSWVASAARAVARWEADGVGGRILLKWLAPPPRWLARNEEVQGNLGLMDFEEPRVLSAPLRGHPAVWGGNMGFRRAVLESLGGFDPTLGPVGPKHSVGEDSDIVHRALANGWRVVYDPSLLVWHRVAPGRMRKVYFWKWAFESGMVEARGAPSAPGPRIFGIPRWWYRAVAAAAVHCIVRSILRRHDAFDCQRELSRALGWAWGLARRCEQGGVRQRGALQDRCDERNDRVDGLCDRPGHRLAKDRVERRSSS
jgi:glycosyltransferase involved in cell wall biosynthesis